MTTARTGFVLGKNDGEELVESLARGLNAANIPCVLWYHFLWATHGIPTTVPVCHILCHLSWKSKQ